MGNELSERVRMSQKDRAAWERRIAVAYQSGVALSAMQERFGVGQDVIRQAIERQGIPLRQRTKARLKPDSNNGGLI